MIIPLTTYSWRHGGLSDFFKGLSKQLGSQVSFIFSFDLYFDSPYPKCKFHAYTTTDLATSVIVAVWQLADSDTRSAAASEVPVAKNDSYSLKIFDLKSARKFSPIKRKRLLSKLGLNYGQDTGPFEKITKGSSVKQTNQMIGASELRLIALEGSQLHQ